MAGRLFAVVGPSGVGKDSLIDALLQARPDMRRARRVITRPSSSGGETFTGVSEAEFEQMAQDGQFVLNWDAHGLRYGVPMSVQDDLEAGHDVVFNGSRAALPQAKARFPNLRILLIEADPAILAQRLAARGREPAAQIEDRLRRASFEMPEGLEVQRIQNNGPLDEALQQVLAACQPERV